MLLDLSPKRTIIDCSGDGHIMAVELGTEKENKSQKEGFHKR